MSKKILVVEDNEENRIMMRDVLRYYGYDVLEAKDGLEGIKMAREHLPDLILLDIQMPVLDGIATKKMLKNDPGTSAIKIIAVTSFAMKGDGEKLLETGFDDYMAKPVDTRALPEIIKKHIGR